MPVHVAVQFNLTARLEKNKRQFVRGLVIYSACVGCFFFFQEHMILCRFADQTAVQLPPERRLIGRMPIHS